MARIYVYIDGHNLYNDLTRRLRGRGKWLDFETLADSIAGDRVQKIWYFTSPVVSLDGDVGPVQRQRVFLAAVRRMRRVEKVDGFMKREPKDMYRVRRFPWQRKRVRVWVAKEKGSDVNLATQLVSDAALDRFDTAFVVSNDSDFARPIAAVANEFKKDVRIVYPSDAPAKQLKKLGVPIEPLWTSTIINSQIPHDTIRTSKGEIHRPPEWPR